MAASPVPPPEPDAGHVPITEEFDSYKHTLPSAAPVAAAMLLVVIVLGILAYVLRAKPIATGSIDEAFAVTLPAQSTSLAVVNVSFRNVTEKPLQLVNVNVAVHVKGASYQDNFASVADIPRYFQALPPLQEHAETPLSRDLMIAPGQNVSGSAIVSVPLTQEDFDARDSMTVTLTFADHPAVKFTAGKLQ